MSSSDSRCPSRLAVISVTASVTGPAWSLRSARSVLVKAAGSRTLSSTGPSAVSTSRSPPPAFEQELTAAAARQQRLPVARDHGHRLQRAPFSAWPPACSALTRPHSAHKVRPNDAFSTLQPTMIRPSEVWPAAPTRSPE